MSNHVDSAESQTAKFPWYFLWVIGALALAATNISDFVVTKRLSSVLLSAAWLLWAFSWYAKPFHISLREKLSNAINVAELRAWVSPSLWNLATIGALSLMIVGELLRLTNVA